MQIKPSGPSRVSALASEYEERAKVEEKESECKETL